MAINLDYSSEQRNYYADLVQNQKVALVPSFTLESGRHLTSVPVAYKTWGKLNDNRDNVIVLCHALSGSSDAEDWWRPLMGPGKAFDYNRFFVVCCNMLGSPYGTASPLTINPETGRRYGPDFPETTFRDDVRINKLILDALEVSSVAAAIGGSMGGMEVLEWPLCTPTGYVRSIIPITTSAYHGAWGISWGEAQRQCIQADGNYQNGWYAPEPSGQPAQGLGAARMVAMLTYRSDQSFNSRFNRQPAKPRLTPALAPAKSGLPTPSPSDAGSSNEQEPLSEVYRPQMQHERGTTPPAEDRKSPERPSQVRFAAQSYMQYQASKFLKRFDANCYIHLTTKMDTHDVTRDRLRHLSYGNKGRPTLDDLKQVMSDIPPKALVISVESDVLFKNEHQVMLAECLPEARFANLDSPDGHDGFLLEFEALSELVKGHLQELFPNLYEGHREYLTNDDGELEEVHHSVFGEAEPEF